MSVGAVNKQTGDRIPTAGMPAIDSELSLSSTNPVQNAIITAALANKQDKTDNNLTTTEKTTTGAINELKSGLTNYENQNNINLEVANRKNILPVSLANVKAKNTAGTWTGNTYAINSGEITLTANADGYITEIVVNGTFATNTTFFKLCDNFSPFETKNYILSGVVADTEQEVIQIYFHNDTDDIDVNPRDKGQGATISLNKGKSYTCYLRVSAGTPIDNNSTYPMLRETWQNATFAPYIPSVESRIEAVESGLTNVNNKLGGAYFLNTSIAVAGSIDVNTTALSKFVIITSNNTTGRGLYICYSDGSNNTNADPVKNASGLTLTAGAGKLNITNGSTGSEREVQVCILVMIGDLTISGVS